MEISATVPNSTSAHDVCVGLAAANIRYRAVVTSSAGADAVARLLRETDAVAEVHNTLRSGVAVELVLE